MREVRRSICLVLPFAVLLACGSFCHGQDAGADTATALLQEGLKQFNAKDYQNAQASLLKADKARKSLTDAERKTLDEYLAKAAAGSRAQAEAKSALAAARKALAANKLDEAEKGFAAAAASEYLTAADKGAAAEQLALVKERKAVAAAMPGPKGKPKVKPAPGLEVKSAPARDPKVAAMMARVKADRAKARRLMEAGRNAMKKRDYDHAKTLFKRALGLAPELEEAQRLLKHARAQSGDIVVGKRILTRFEQERRVARQASDVDIATALKRAREILVKPEKNAADFDSADSAVNVAGSTLKRNKSLYPPSDYLENKQRIEDLRSFVEMKRQAWVEAERKRKLEEVNTAEAKRVQKLKVQRLRKISTLTEQIRTLVGRKQFQEALDVTDHVLRLDRANRYASEQKILLTQLVSMQLERHYLQKLNAEQRRSMVDIREAEIPWYDYLRYPDDWREITRRREAFGAGAMGESEIDRIARAKLRTRINELDFKGTAFREVVDFLRNVSGANIYVKWRALEDEGIDESAEVRNVKLADVTVEKALQVILEDVGGGRPLGFVIDQGVVTISTKSDLAQNTTTRVYDIRDLIIEIRDFDAPRIDLSAAVGDDEDEDEDDGGGLFPDDDDDDDDDVQERRTRRELAEDIMNLIRETIAPETWRPDGEIGSITELNGQLVVTQTAENHRSLLDLINQLREAKALQIAVEARFISVSTGFLNSIGLDLDLYFNIGSRLGNRHVTDPYTGASVPTILPNPITGAGGSSAWGTGKSGEDQLTPIGMIQGNQGVGRSIGFASILGTASPINVGTSIGSSITSPSLSVQGTFLDDIQVDFLIEATQAHQATRSLTAPRITLFNGQTAYVNIATQQAYVADLEAVIAENAVTYNPRVATVPTGTVLGVTGTVSADRRYVTLEVNPQIAALNGFTKYFTTVTGTDADGNPITGEGYIQLPNVTIQELRTTVSVPDGGTLLLGGQRAAGQIEREKGVPLLSKIPIINRAFTNRAMVRDETTLLILIRVKIIIQREEEEKWFPD